MRHTVEANQRRAAEAQSRLLLSKLHSPAVREQTVACVRLVERLRPRAGVKLTVVAAPAGCGKTTLLRGLARGRSAPAASRVGDARRRKQRSRRPMVAHSRGAPAGLSGSWRVPVPPRGRQRAHRRHPEPMTCLPNAFRSGDAVLVLEPGESTTAAFGVQPMESPGL